MSPDEAADAPESDRPPGNSRLAVGGGLLVLLSAVVSVAAFPELPAEMATHWNATGEVDGTMPRSVALAFFPALTAVTLGFLVALPRVDPRDGYESFGVEYDALALATVGFVVYAQVVVVLVNLDADVGVLQALAPAIGAIYVLAGYVTERTDQSWFVGARTPWTLEDEDVWRRTNDAVAAVLKVGGLVAALGLLFPAYALALVVLPAVATAVVSVGYSYHRYRRSA